MFTCFNQEKKTGKKSEIKERNTEKSKSSKSHCNLQVKALLSHGRWIHAGSPCQVALELQSMSHMPSQNEAGSRGAAAVGEVRQMQIHFFHLEMMTMMG